MLNQYTIEELARERLRPMTRVERARAQALAELASERAGRRGLVGNAVHAVLRSLRPAGGALSPDSAHPAIADSDRLAPADADAFVGRPF